MIQDDITKLEQQVSEATVAQILQSETSRDRVMESPVLQTAHDAIRADLLQALLNSPQRDKEGQLELVALLKLNERYRQSLRHVIETGRVAKDRLNWLQRMMRRAA